MNIENILGKASKQLNSLNIKNAVIDNNTITIPNADKNCHHRIFLLKWIYYYYVKRTKHHIPKLKETLILQNHC